MEARRDWPQILRSLLLAWGTAEEDADAAELLTAAGDVGARLLEMAAPLDAAWALFPMESDGRTVCISYAADAMEALAQLWAAGGCDSCLGRAQHIAHILQSQQAMEGCWPQRVDARSGRALDDRRCAAAPMMLMNRLDQMLGSREFSTPVWRARRWLLSQVAGTIEPIDDDRCSLAPRRTIEETHDG